MKVNLHTHTARCHHAKGTDEEYVLAAIEAGVKKLGFSDHTPLPYENGYINKQKMLPEELDGYIASILALKEKYKDQIEILVGLECEAVERFIPYLREQKQRLDYLILGNHGDWSIGEPYMGRVSDSSFFPMYLETTVTSMESGLYLYLAHPDLIFGSYPEFDDKAKWLSREICKEANRLHMPLEYNMYGVKKGRQPGKLGYPCDAFWEIAAEENVHAVVGLDAHMPEMFLTEDPDGAFEHLKNMGITVFDDPFDA